MSRIRRVGITGAAGVLGTVLTRGLAGRYELVLFDVNTPRQPGDARVVKVELSRQENVRGLFDGLDALIHLAGNPLPDAPRSATMKSNFLATSLSFEEARRAGLKKIVFASSNFYHEGDVGEALMGKLGRRITLDMPPTPQCLYGESKVYGENVGRHLACLGTPFVALRIGWTVKDDNPSRYGGAYMGAVFCSHRDLVEAFSRGLEVETEFLAAFAVSNNTHGIFDLAETREKLGFNPQDDAASS